MRITSIVNDVYRIIVKLRSVHRSSGGVSEAHTLIRGLLPELDKYRIKEATEDSSGDLLIEYALIKINDVAGLEEQKCKINSDNRPQNIIPRNPTLTRTEPIL